MFAKIKELATAGVAACAAALGATLSTIAPAAAVPLYPNDFTNNEVVRLQMEKTAPNGTPVTLNITPQYGFRNGGLFNTWIGADNDSLFRYITNGYGINLQRVNSNYSISVKDVNITRGNTTNTYSSGFGRYQDWNLQKLGGSFGDTYLFRWRTDLDTNLCLDIRGFGQNQQLNNQIPIVWDCDPSNPNQRIRVIKQGQAPTPAPVSNANTPYLPFDPGVSLTVTTGYGGHGGTYGNFNRYALDFGAAGKNVSARATRTGVVTYSGWRNGGFGNVVEVRYNDGKYGNYQHLSQVYVTKGSTVVGGQGLGKIGNTGNSTGPHLHYMESNSSFGASVPLPQFADAPNANFNNSGFSLTSQNPDNRR
jgi:murein DD-endopeptidase MepM/ murein hydrolase activator NlpD